MENLSKENQIEEMAKAVNERINKSTTMTKVYEALYDAGYRKQSENTIELPCKVGDRIYRLNHLCSVVNEATVKAFYYTEDKKYYPKSHLIIQYDLARGRIRVNFSEIGKTVFFTKEDAESALAKMKGGAE